MDICRFIIVLGHVSRFIIVLCHVPTTVASLEPNVSLFIAPTHDSLDKFPWCSGSSGIKSEFVCMDNTRCNAIELGNGCCVSRGGRAKCPFDNQFMCRNPNSCAEGTSHCCVATEKSCQTFGGLRDCPNASTEYPWCEGHSAVRNQLVCMDQTRCNITEAGSGCCVLHGGIRNCPMNKPFMCGRPNACASETSYCCVADEDKCTRSGGLRYCPEVARDCCSPIVLTFPTGEKVYFRKNGTNNIYISWFNNGDTQILWHNGPAWIHGLLSDYPAALASFAWGYSTEDTQCPSDINSWEWTDANTHCASLNKTGMQDPTQQEFSEVSVCRGFSIGDGVGSEDQYLGIVNSVEECISLVCDKKEANGITISNSLLEKNNGSCYANVGMKWRFVVSDWHTCSLTNETRKRVCDNTNPFSNYTIFTYIFFGLLGAISGAIFLYGKKYFADDINTGNANYLVPGLIVMQLYDYVTDINVALDIYFLYDNIVLLWTSIAGLIIPFVVNTGIVIYLWIQELENPEAELSIFYKKHSFSTTVFLFFSCLHTENMRIIWSNMFRKPMLNAPISTRTKNIIGYTGIINVVLEDIVQLGVQLYMLTSGDYRARVIISMILTLINIQLNGLRKTLNFLVNCTEKRRASYAPVKMNSCSK